MSSPYTANPSATRAPAAQPLAGVLPIITLPADGDPDAAATYAQAFQALTDYVGYLMQSAAGSPFGDGSDGSVTIGAGTTTLVRDMYYNNLTVPAGATLKPNGFRVYVRNTLTTSGGGSISADGNAASGATAGAATGTGTILGGAAGGAGGASAVGANGTAQTNSAGGAGGAGGASGGGNAGGTGGTVTALTAAQGSYRIYTPSMGHINGLSGGVSTWTAITGGAGGGGGGGTTGTGGGGGGGAGVIMIAARTVSMANASDIHAVGGAGASGVSGSAGAGGGGGGGLIVIYYGSMNQSVFGAANWGGGAAGTIALGTGALGAAGASGTMLAVQLA